MIQNEYARLVREQQLLNRSLRDLKDKIVFVNFHLVSKYYGKFHLRSFINLVRNTSPELLESCRTSEGGSDYVYLNGSKEDLVAIIDLTIDHFDIQEDHQLHNGFKLARQQICKTAYSQTIIINDHTMEI